MKRLKKVLVVMLTLAMTFSSFTLLNNVNAEETAKNYTIYPTPHDIKYGGGEFSISDGVNVVYGDTIDSFTKDHLVDVLNILNKKATVTSAVVEGKTNVIVGVYGSNDYADKYFKDNNLISDKGLFDKYDSYVLSIKDGVIGILGKDTDASFYGITSLKHIFNQIKNNSVLNLTINDYADVKGRGFIEGYYGNPWSNEDRADLMTFGGDYKLNQYIYAPKDDPKHNSNWKALYTDEELIEIAKLAEAGNKSKCYYVYALHPYMHNPVRYNSEANYQEDLNIIKTKFEQLMGAGVKQFAILADDASVPTDGTVDENGSPIRKPELYNKLMKDLTDWLIEKKATVEGLKSDTLFCPNDYMGWGVSQQMQTLKDLPDSVSIIQTGGKVWGEVGPNFNNAFYQSMGRPAYMWINWPCSDNTKEGLIMGGAEAVLKPNVDAYKVDGIVLNPMQQSEPSKQGLFTNADYAWNIWKNTEHYDKVWNDSFAFMDHGTIDETVASNALREISKHMMNSKQIDNGESFDLAPKLDQFLKDLNAGVDITAQAEDLKLEFQKLYNAAESYKANPGNERTRDQIIYWLDCWLDTTTAVLNYLDAAIALQNNEANNVVWDYYANGQAAFEQSKTHGFLYVDHTEYAVAGRLHVTPFMNSLDNILSGEMETIINPNKQIIKYITNRTDTPTGSTDNVFDNKANTEIVYKSPNSISEGTYVGISYNKAIDIDKVIFRLGTNNNAKDTFLKAKVQYTNDGKEWKDLDETIYDLPNEVILENLGLKSVKGIRMIATEVKSNTWLGIRDIAVNPADEPIVEDNGTISIDKISRQGGALTNLTDGNTSTFTHFAEDPYKGGDITDYIPVDAAITLTYKNPKKLGTINFVQDSGTDKVTKYVIEYTVDGEVWQSLGEYAGDATVNLDVNDQNIMAKAIRVRNLELHLKTDKVGYWWKVYDFSMVDAESDPHTLTYSSTWSVYQGTVANLSDGDDTTDIEFDSGAEDNTLVGDYLQWDLGKVTPIGKIHAAVGGKRDAGNKWTKYRLEYSSDGENWTTFKEYTGVASGKDIIDENFYGVEARYVRLTNMEQRHVWVIFSEFTVKEFDPNTDFDTANVYSNTDYKLISNYSEDITKLSYNGNITLAKDEFVGVDLKRIKDLSEININTTDGDALTIQVSKNKVEWESINAKALPDARYVRLINLTDAPVTFALNNFTVASNEVFAPRIHETTFGITPGWGEAEDTRNNGAAFDGNVDTTTEFGTLPQKGQYAIYDLGQERTISKLEMYCQDSAVNYLRDAEILISNDLVNWTKVITIGDGVENIGDANVTCLNSDAGYRASSTYPNKVSVSGTIAPETARYLKIVATATNNNRAVVFNEIVINDGEYAPVSNDPTFEASAVEVQGFIPQYMLDGDLTTAYKPNTTDAGFIKYTLSDNLDVKKMNIIQKGTPSNAKVMALVMVDGKKQWIQVGTLSKSLNEIYLPFWENLYELKFEWNANNIPTISEIVMLNDVEFGADHNALTEYIDSLKINEADYTKSTYDAYVKALTNANEVNKDNNSTPKALEDALAELKTAVAKLVTRGNSQLVKDELAKIDALTAEDYTEATWDALQIVVTDAENLLKKDVKEISEKEVTDMVEALQKAKAALITKVSVSKDELQKYIDTNGLDTLDTSKYLTSTAEPFAEALKTAHDLIANDKATLQQLEDALTALQEARTSLVLKATDDEVNALNGLINSYKETDYTASSWKEFAKVLADVQTALKEENSSEDIAELTETLTAAAKVLVKRGDLTDLNILLETAEALNKDKYTEASYGKLLAVIADIKEQLKDTSEMLQADVDALQEKLQAAIDALEARPAVIPTPGDTTTPDGTTPGTSTSTKTGDTAMIGTFVALGMLSVAGLWIYRKKENC